MIQPGPKKTDRQSGGALALYINTVIKGGLDLAKPRKEITSVVNFLRQPLYFRFANQLKEHSSIT